MNTHVVLTPANIEIEYRLAGAGSRLAAFVIDFVIQMLSGLVLSFVILFGIYGYRFNTLANVEGFALGALIIAWFAIYFLYFIVLELCMNGQSIGKRIFGLRVIRDNGQPVGLAQSLVRNLFKSVLDILYVGLLFMMFSKKHKRIGDMVAGTIVVVEHYGGVLAPRTTDPIQVDDPGMARLKDFAHLILDDSEKELLHMYLARKMHLPDGGRAIQSKFAKHFSEKWQMEESWIDDTLLSGLLKINERSY